MCSQSRVTYAFGGRKPEPRNAFGRFVGFFHRMYGSGAKPRREAETSVSAGFGQTRNSPSTERRVSPMLTARIPPGTSTR
jgi:hypothetical protein